MCCRAACTRILRSVRSTNRRPGGCRGNRPTRSGPPAGAVVKIQGSGGALAFINANNTLAGASKSFDEAGTSITTATCGTFPP